MVRLVPYDPNWVLVFEGVAADIRRALGSAALALEHVGSTAVPALAAKPVVDVLVFVESYDPEETYRSPLGALGFLFDHRDETHVFFTGNRSGTALHVHVVESHAKDARTMVLFRDYLRAHPDEARRYEALKRDLATRHADPNVYAAAKSTYVLEVVRKAEAALRSPGPAEDVPAPPELSARSTAGRRRA